MRGILVALLAGLASCGGGGGGAQAVAPGQLDPRPAGSPDVVFLTVSGRNFDPTDLFCPPACNVPYLGTEGAAGDIEAVFDALGLTYQSGHYTASLLDYDVHHGFLELVANLQAIHEDWIDGYEDPTRIVLMGHSHGAVWAHLACAVMEHVPIECLITLDGICTLWESDYGPDIDAYVAANSNPFPFDISDACARWAVPGHPASLDTKDVVFDNVARNLEVQSGDLFVFDAVDNVRLDGLKQGIDTLAAAESHNGVRLPGSASLDWVALELADLLSR